MAEQVYYEIAKWRLDKQLVVMAAGNEEGVQQ